MVNEVSAGKAKRIYKVVLTGGPCGGKTTGQDRLRTFFEGIGWQVYTVPETATILLGGGVKFSELSAEQAYGFQKDLLLTLMRIESVFFNQAMLSNAEKVLVICDRGAMDPSAYIDATSWKAYLNDLNLDQFTIRDNRYDQVIHMTTAADGAEEYYTLANNSIRKEGIEQAIKVDRLTRSAWLGHPRVDVIDNIGCKSFEDKIRRLIAAVCKRIGIQTQDRLAFNSRKRKWLVEAVDDAKMPHCEVFKVVHSYLSTEDPKSQVRLRSRTQDGHTTYTITTRQFDLSEPVETQMQITWREYNSYMKMADPYRAQINKLRKCFMFDGQYFQLDIYTSPLPPNCAGKPLMFLETYTTAPIGNTESPKLPDFLTIQKEITGVDEYSMYVIAKLGQPQPVKQKQNEFSPLSCLCCTHLFARGYNHS